MVGTPGRLMDLIERKVLDLSDVKTVVIDEADEMLNMGFIEDVEKILATTPHGTADRALLARPCPRGSAPWQTASCATRNPSLMKHATVTVQATEQRYYLVHESDKTERADASVRDRADQQRADLCPHARRDGQLANELVVRGIPRRSLNGDLDQNARERVLGRFRPNQFKVLVATDVAARGLDIDDISHVFNYPPARRRRSLRPPHRADGARRQNGHCHHPRLLRAKSAACAKWKR